MRNTANVRKFYLMIAGLSALVFPLFLNAAETNAAKTDTGKTGPQDTKVAVVDMRRAIINTSAFQEKLKVLQSQKDYAEMQKKTESLRQQILKKQDEAQKEGATWTPDQRDSNLKDMEFLRKDFELAAQKIQAENEQLFNTVGKDMESKVKQVMQQIIESENISLLLRAEAALWATPEVDITDEVTRKLDQAK